MEILLYVFMVLVFCFVVWHGLKITFYVGNIGFTYEIYPAKRFFDPAFRASWEKEHPNQG